VQAADRFVTPAPLWNHNPAGTDKGCRGATMGILMIALAGHNSGKGENYASGRRKIRNN